MSSDHREYLEIQSEMMDIMRVLQFEDIVSQISERVAYRISDIRHTVDLISHLHDSEFSVNFEEDVEKMKVELVDIKKKLSNASAKKNCGSKKYGRRRYRSFLNLSRLLNYGIASR